MSPWQHKPARIAAVAIAGSALVVSAWPAATHLMTGAASRPTAVAGQADAVGTAPAGGRQAAARRRPAAAQSEQSSQLPDIVSVAVAARPGRHRKPGPAQTSAYASPLRSVSDLVPERVDEGVDFSGTGPVYALGDGVVTSAEAEGSGWPGGGWITYQLTDGPDAGLMVYLAEDVTPDVQVGEHVTPATVIGTMFAGADGIETGWAQPGGGDAESDSPPAGSIGASGPYPTKVGVSFDALLQSLGVPAAPNYTQPAYGLLPAGYPAD